MPAGETQGTHEPTGTCWDLAVAAAAHHGRGNAERAHAPNHEIFQVSTISALIEGILDGDTPYREVMRHGDLGLGTFNALNGEMVAVDGDYFQMFSDGSISPVNPDDLTPFCAVTFFAGDAAIEIKERASRDEVLAQLDAAVPSENLFYPLRIDGHFARVTTRTVSRQAKPYPSLSEASAHQVEHAFANVEGTIVGFRSPQYAQGLTVAGYHLHFVDAERRCGGHVLDFDLNWGAVLADQDADIHLELPTSEQFMRTAMDAEDLSSQIQEAENVKHRK